MKKIIFVCLLLATSSSMAYAQRSREPLNFRGIEWDTYYSAIPGMRKVYSKNEKIDVFKKDNEEMSLGTCKLDNLSYEGFNGRIYKVNLSFSICDPGVVFDMFKKKYGECASVEDSLEQYIGT